MEWIYEMLVDIMAYASGELIHVMSMDPTYFEQNAPIISTIVDVFIALGWALLLGNLVFQALKSMLSEIGFESEDPKILFARTFVFAFLLLGSRQICEIAMGITGKVIALLGVPSSLDIITPNENLFHLGSGAKWLLVIIVGVILMLQMVKLLFEIGERYVITSILTFFAPLAFAMGGSKNTGDIFKGWCRMYGSMLVMMLMNIVFLKLILSAMTRMASGGVLVWLVFVVALTRVARKIDSHIGKIGLNPAQTGNSVGSRLPGMITMVAVRSAASLLVRSPHAGGGERKSGSTGGNFRSSGIYSNACGSNNKSRQQTQYNSMGTGSRPNTEKYNERASQAVQSGEQKGSVHHPAVSRNAQSSTLGESRPPLSRTADSTHASTDKPIQNTANYKRPYGAVPNHEAGSGPEQDRDLKQTSSSMYPHSRPPLSREQEMQRQKIRAANPAYDTGKKSGNANPPDAKDNFPVSKLPQSHAASDSTEKGTTNRSHRQDSTSQHEKRTGISEQRTTNKESHRSQDTAASSFPASHTGYAANQQHNNPAAANRKNKTPVYRKQTHGKPPSESRRNTRKTKRGDDKHRK